MSAISEVDIRDWERAVKIVDDLPLAKESDNNLSFEDYKFLIHLFLKQIEAVPQVPALFKRPHLFAGEEKSSLTPYPYDQTR